jgi:hypothetical protein
LNRVAYARWEAERNRGYDIVSTKPQTFPKPHPNAQNSAWRNLQANDNDGIAKTTSTSARFIRTQPQVRSSDSGRVPTIDIASSVAPDLVTKIQTSKTTGNLAIKTTQGSSVRTGGIK